MRTLLFALAAAAVLAGGASADGLPVLGIDVGSSGVTTSSGQVRYVSLPDGRRTIVAQTARSGGQIVGVTRLSGSFTIPAVAYDGSASGLSADGTRLVLIEPRQSFPRVATTFALLDAPRLRLLRTIRLRGDFSFDAVSPDGSRMFLVQYTSPNDPDRYAVRAYDLRAGRLLPAPVVDPRERGEAMRGKPLTRTASVDGRWAYTLYDGGGGTPFVHALDTATGTARCIDLPMLDGRRDLWQLRLERSGRELRVGDAAVIPTQDFAVTVPHRSTRVAGAAVVGGATLVVVVLGWAFLPRNRRNRGQSAKPS
jgi:hypothetical protein